MKYYCCVRNHIDKIETIIKEFNTFENCLLYIQEYYEDYIYNKQGNKKDIEYFNYPPTSSEFKEGLHVRNDEYLRWNIVQRTRSIGFIYNDFIDETLFTISSARGISNIGNTYSVDKNNISRKYEWKPQFNKIIRELEGAAPDSLEISELEDLVTQVIESTTVVDNVVVCV